MSNCFSRIDRKIWKLLFPVFLFFLLAQSPPASGQTWTPLGKGMEYATFVLRSSQERGEPKIHVLRLDPHQVSLRLFLASQMNTRSRSPEEWIRDFQLAAAINAGMFQQDLRTHVGYLRNGPYIQNRLWNHYKAAFAMNPRQSGLAPAVIVDLDLPNARNILNDYDVVIQNLRLIKGKGVNVWSKSEKKWSEAALGIDSQGRLLWLFCPQPVSMWDFIEGVLALPLGVEQMLHLEGGSLAGMSIKTRELELDLAGTDFFTQSTGLPRVQWPIPNVIGITTR